MKLGTSNGDFDCSLTADVLLEKSIKFVNDNRGFFESQIESMYVEAALDGQLYTIEEASKETLIRKGTLQNLYIISAANGSKDALSQLNAQEKGKALIIAAENGNQEATQKIVDDMKTGATSDDAKSLENARKKAFTQAAKEGHVNTMRYLLDDSVGRYDRGQALIKAANNGKLGVVEVLLTIDELASEQNKITYYYIAQALSAAVQVRINEARFHYLQDKNLNINDERKKIDYYSRIENLLRDRYQGPCNPLFAFVPRPTLDNLYQTKIKSTQDSNEIDEEAQIEDPNPQDGKCFVM